MARRSGGRSAPRPAARSAPRSPPPQTVNRAPAPAPAQASGGGGLMGSFGSTIAQGMAFATGSAIAHRAADAVMGPRTINMEMGNAETQGATQGSSAVPSNADACSIHSKAFQDCLNNYGSDISRCQFYIDMLSECKKNSGVMGA